MTKALSLDRVLIAIEPAKKLRLVILDACRDNPFSRTMKRTVASRAIGQGLAKVEPTSPNVLIAYSAKAGSTAADGDGKNSPFTAALSKHLTKPGLDVRRAFGFVRDEVLKTTGNKQEPFVYGSLGGEDVPLVPAPAPAAAAAGGARPQSAGRSPPRLRTGAADRQQERAERLPCAISRWLLRQPRQASARQDRRRGNPRRRDRKGAAGRTGAGAARRRGRPEGAAGKGRSRRQGRRAGAHRG